MILTNDLTQAVMDEAVSQKANMILSYHPPIFAPLKRLTQGKWKERITIQCIENRIALYSPHTSFDAVKGGVNDWLIEPFGEYTLCNFYYYPPNQKSKEYRPFTNLQVFVFTCILDVNRHKYE